MMISGNEPILSIPAFTLEQIWEMVTQQIRSQMGQNKLSAYIRDCRVVEMTGEAVVIAAADAEARDWLESRMASTFARLIAPLVGHEIRVDFVYLRETGEPAGQGSGSGESREGKRGRGAGIKTRPSLVPAAETTVESSPGAADRREGEPDEWLALEEISDSIEGALQNRGRIVAFPRYELRHLPLVGPENFFLRLAFLQMRFLNTPPNGRGQAFTVPVEALLQWANVGRATLHRFKKGDPGRGTQPAAGWFGIEQLPGEPRSGPTQPPCRYRLQTGVPLTPMDAERLREELIAAGVRVDPLAALRGLCERPVHSILQFPPPAPTEAQKKQAPAFHSVAGVVQGALGGKKIAAEQRGEFQEWVNRLDEHITMPAQMVHVSWYFLQEWLPVLGHDAAALILYARAQGYYNPQTQELREVVPVAGGYGELAGVIGLKRTRTIGDWLPNIFERSDADRTGGAFGEKWQREQVRQKQAQETIGRFIQVVAGSRKKTAAGNYSFDLRVEIKGEPLTSRDQTASRWARQVIDQCADEGVLEHFAAWVTSPVITARSGNHPDSQNDGAGILPPSLSSTDNCKLTTRQLCWRDNSPQNDVWGILAAREMTARESSGPDNDGWGILEKILNDGAGILAEGEMTAGELFKILWRLNTFWKSIPEFNTTTRKGAETGGVVVAAEKPTAEKPAAKRSGESPKAWDLKMLCERNGGMNPYREQIIARVKDAADSKDTAQAFVSWLLYAYSLKGRGIKDPFGWALARIKDQPGAWAEGAYTGLARLEPAELARLLRRHIETGVAPASEGWDAAFGGTPVGRLKEMADALGI